MIQRITSREMVREGIKAYLARYDDGHIKEFLANCKAVRSLDPETCSVEQVDAATGVAGWATNRCDECNEQVREIFAIGPQQIDFDDGTFLICKECVSKLYAEAFREPV